MINKESRNVIRQKKHLKIRNRFSGTAERPRLAVYRSNNHVYAQIIDDTVGKTLVSASTVEKKPQDLSKTTQEILSEKIDRYGSLNEELAQLRDEIIALMKAQQLTRH